MAYISPVQDGIFIFPSTYISIGLKLSVRQSSSLSIIMHTFSALLEFDGIQRKA